MALKELTYVAILDEVAPAIKVWLPLIFKYPAVRPLESSPLTIESCDVEDKDGHCPMAIDRKADGIGEVHVDKTELLSNDIDATVVGNVEETTDTLALLQ